VAPPAPSRTIPSGFATTSACVSRTARWKIEILLFAQRSRDGRLQDLPVTVADHRVLDCPGGRVLQRERASLDLLDLREQLVTGSELIISPGCQDRFLSLISTPKLSGCPVERHGDVLALQVRDMSSVQRKVSGSALSISRM